MFTKEQTSVLESPQTQAHTHTDKSNKDHFPMYSVIRVYLIRHFEDIDALMPDEIRWQYTTARAYVCVSCVCFTRPFGRLHRLQLLFHLSLSLTLHFVYCFFFYCYIQMSVSSHVRFSFTTTHSFRCCGLSSSVCLCLFAVLHCSYATCTCDGFSACRGPCGPQEDQEEGGKGKFRIAYVCAWMDGWRECFFTYFFYWCQFVLIPFCISIRMLFFFLFFVLLGLVACVLVLYAIKHHLKWNDLKRYLYTVFFYFSFILPLVLGACAYASVNTCWNCYYYFYFFLYTNYDR